MDFIKECLAQLKMRLRLDTAIVEKLEELEGRIKALEEHQKLDKAGFLVVKQEVGELKLLVRSERKA